MHLFIDESFGNGEAAVKLYAEKYCQRILLNPHMSHAVDDHISGTGTPCPSTEDHGRRRSAGALDVEERVMKHMKENLLTTVRRIQVA